LGPEGPDYTQEYLPVKKDIRIIIVGKEPVHYYWRIAPDNDSRTNVSQAGDISFAPLPPKSVALALETSLTLIALFIKSNKSIVSLENLLIKSMETRFSWIQ